MPSSISLVDSNADILVDELIAIIHETGAQLLVLDTWAQATNGGDENSSEAVGRVLRAIHRIIAETGAAVVAVDHTGWGGDAQGRPRGWSGKWAATDFAIHVKGDIKEGPVQCLIPRQKDRVDDTPFVFGSERVQLGTDEDGDLIESYIAVELSEADAATALASLANKATSKAYETALEAVYQ